MQVVATAAYESDWEDAAADAASGIIGGEWATNPWSLGLAVARPGSQRSQRGSVVARSSASEEGVDTAQVRQAAGLDATAQPALGSLLIPRLVLPLSLIPTQSFRRPPIPLYAPHRRCWAASGTPAA